MEELVLKIGKDTNFIKAAKSIQDLLIKGIDVYVDVIGVAANYIATKSFIQVNKESMVYGYMVTFSPSYVELTTASGQKTAIRWQVVRM